MKRTFYLLLAAVAVIAGCNPQPKYANHAEKVMAEIHNPDSKYVVVACHRGDWRNYPENSIGAIESVIRMGADIVEIDLKLTKDSVLVLSHDRTCNRMTTGKGDISTMTLDSLLKFNLKTAHGVKKPLHVAVEVHVRSADDLPLNSPRDARHARKRLADT